MGVHMPDKSDSLFKEAWAHFKIRDYEQAERLVTQALKDKPESQMGWVLKAAILDECGQPNEVKQIMEKLSDPAGAWFLLGAQMQADEMDAQRIMPYYDRVTDLKPDFSSAWYNKALLYLYQLNEPNSAKVCLAHISLLKEFSYRRGVFWLEMLAVDLVVLVVVAAGWLSPPLVSHTVAIQILILVGIYCLFMMWTRTSVIFRMALDKMRFG
jgi:tetratricopeptide (TPR) repeat protein